MSFLKTEPQPTAAETPRVTAAVVKNRFGTTSVALVISPQAAKTFDAKSCDVLLGQDEDEGQLQLEGRGKGGFSLGRAGGSGGRVGLRLNVPCGPGVPTEETARALCRIVELEPGLLRIELPREAWANPPEAPAAPTSPPPPAGQGAAPKPNSEGLDVVTYLKNKGRKVERSGSVILLDAQPIPHEQAVRMVNAHRSEAGLVALRPDQAW